MLKAADGADNRMQSDVERTVVPFDDGDTAYQASYVGFWEEERREGSFVNGVHRSTSVLDSFTFSGEGSKYCFAFQRGQEFGNATFVVGDRTAIVDMTPKTDGSKNFHCLVFDTEEPRTASVRVDHGAINIDGYWIDSSLS